MCVSVSQSVCMCVSVYQSARICVLVGVSLCVSLYVCTYVYPSVSQIFFLLKSFKSVNYIQIYKMDN